MLKDNPNLASGVIGQIDQFYDTDGGNTEWTQNY
jgi:hypothetical protein